MPSTKEIRNKEGDVRTLIVMALVAFLGTPHGESGGKQVVVGVLPQPTAIIYELPRAQERTPDQSRVRTGVIEIRTGESRPDLGTALSTLEPENYHAFRIISAERFITRSGQPKLRITYIAAEHLRTLDQLPRRG